MELSLTPELDEFVRQQAQEHGFPSGSEYVAQLICAERDRENHDWTWLHEQIRPGLEADESEFRSETAEQVIQRGMMRLGNHG